MAGLDSAQLVSAHVVSVSTETALVNGEWWISTKYRIKTPEPFEIKFVAIYYVHETKLSTKFSAKPSMGILSKLVNYNVFVTFM